MKPILIVFFLLVASLVCLPSAFSSQLAQDAFVGKYRLIKCQKHAVVGDEGGVIQGVEYSIEIFNSTNPHLSYPSVVKLEVFRGKEKLEGLPELEVFELINRGWNTDVYVGENGTITTKEVVYTTDDSLIRIQKRSEKKQKEILKFTNESHSHLRWIRQIGFWNSTQQVCDLEKL